MLSLVMNIFFQTGMCRNINNNIEKKKFFPLKEDEKNVPSDIFLFKE